MRISSIYIVAIAIKVITGLSAWRSNFKQVNVVKFYYTTFTCNTAYSISYIPQYLCLNVVLEADTYHLVRNIIFYISFFIAEFLILHFYLKNLDNENHEYNRLTVDRKLSYQMISMMGKTDDQTVNITDGTMFRRITGYGKTSVRESFVSNQEKQSDTSIHRKTILGKNKQIKNDIIHVNYSPSKLRKTTTPRTYQDNTQFSLLGIKTQITNIDEEDEDGYCESQDNTQQDVNPNHTTVMQSFRVLADGLDQESEQNEEIRVDYYQQNDSLRDQALGINMTIANNNYTIASSLTEDDEPMVFLGSLDRSKQQDEGVQIIKKGFLSKHLFHTK